MVNGRRRDDLTRLVSSWLLEPTELHLHRDPELGTRGDQRWIDEAARALAVLGCYGVVIVKTARYITTGC